MSLKIVTCLPTVSQDLINSFTTLRLEGEEWKWEGGVDT
jgi:hypothetical protein